VIDVRQVMTHSCAGVVPAAVALGQCRFCGERIEVRTAMATPLVILAFGECLDCRRYTVWQPVDVGQERGTLARQ
jgi:hypothetical protein